MDWQFFANTISPHGTTIRDSRVYDSRSTFDYIAQYSPAHKTFYKEDGSKVSLLMRSGSETDEWIGRTNHKDVDRVLIGDMLTHQDTRWIVIKREFDDEVSRRCVLKQCNQLFKFQTFDGEIYERWGVFDPGVYSTTIKGDDFYMHPDLQFKIYMSKDEQTEQWYVDKRFATNYIYDKDGTRSMQVYRVTGFDPNSESYSTGRILRMFCRSDIYLPDKDNLDLMLCDYIAPKENGPVPVPPPGESGWYL